MSALEERKRERAALAPQERSLLATPQRWGILPTKWFWNKASNWKHLVPLIVVVSAVLLPLLVLFFKAVGGIHYPLLFVFGLAASGELSLGLLERYVRKKALQRAEEHQRQLPVVSSTSAP